MASSNQFCLSVGRLVGWSACQLVGWLVGWSVGWLARQLVSQLIGWSVGRSVGQLIGWSVGRSVGQSIGQFGWLVGQSSNTFKQVIKMHQSHRCILAHVYLAISSVHWSVGRLVGRLVGRWSVGWLARQLVIDVS